MVSSSSISVFRPWPRPDKTPKNLGEFIARINIERGGFRNFTEESLRREIAAHENENATPQPGVEDMNVDVEEVEENSTPKAKDTRAVRDELLKDIETAHQTAMVTLDTISLLLSKENPNQAGSTLSKLARDSVGIGTLGASVVGHSFDIQEKRQENTLIATGARLLDVNRTADTLVASAKRLQDEISVESKYWAEVLAVSDAGWSLTRLPYERRTLGVQFGFAEAATEFRSGTVAPIRRRDDGNVSLACGRLGGEPQRLVVSIEKNGRVVGRSRVPKPLPEDASLADRVLEARNTVFSQELWHEINRDARSLTSYQVRLEDDDVSYSLDPKTKYLFSLVPLEDDESRSDAILGHEEDDQAEMITWVLNLLLTHAHRLNNSQRTQFGPAGSKQRTSSQYALLRPIIAHLLHEQSITKAAGFFADLTAALQAAGISTATYTLTEPPIVAWEPRAGALDSLSTVAETTIASLTGPLDFQLELIITPNTRIKILGRTFQSPFIATQYQIHLLPPEGSSDPEANPLFSTFAPVDSYPDLCEMVYYVRQAVARALAEHFEGVIAQWVAADYPTSSDSLSAGNTRIPKWLVSIRGTAIRDEDLARKSVRFEVTTDSDVSARNWTTQDDRDDLNEYKYDETDDEEPKNDEPKDDAMDQAIDNAMDEPIHEIIADLLGGPTPNGPKQKTDRLALQLHGAWRQGDETVKKTWTWVPEDDLLDGDGELWGDTVPLLQDVVRDVYTTECTAEV